MLSRQLKQFNILVRSLMQEAAIRHQVGLTRISFKGTVDTLRHWSASLEAMRDMPPNNEPCLARCSKSSPTTSFPSPGTRGTTREKTQAQERSSADKATPRNENFRSQKPSQIHIKLVPFQTDPGSAHAHATNSRQETYSKFA